MPAGAAPLSNTRRTSLGKSAHTKSEASPCCLLNEEAEFLVVVVTLRNAYFDDVQT